MIIHLIKLSTTINVQRKFQNGTKSLKFLKSLYGINQLGLLKNLKKKKESFPFFRKKISSLNFINGMNL